MAVDVLAIGAHPDDVELGVGGILSKLAAQGYATAIVDLTRGEMSSRGTPGEREEEALEASKTLSAGARKNAGLPDCRVQNVEEQQTVLIALLREFAPRVILTHHQNDRHPDHRAAYHLVRDANFFAGLTAIEGSHPPHRADYFYYFHPYYQEGAAPAIVIDITGHMETKLQALRAHKSQFHNPDYSGPETYISSPEFWDGIRDRAAYWGQTIGVRFGEALYCEGPVKLNTLPGLLPLS